MGQSTYKVTSHERKTSAEGSRRASHRRAVNQSSIARTAAGSPYQIEVTDFSREGCRFVSDQPMVIGSHIRMGLSGAGAATCEIIWHKEGSYGCRFLAPLSDAAMAEAFTGPTVVHVRSPEERLPEPAGIGTYARRTRALIFVGGAAAAWAAVFALVALIR